MTQLATKNSIFQIRVVRSNYNTLMITRSGRFPDAAIAVTSPEILVRVQHDAKLASAEHEIVHSHDDIVDVEEEASLGIQNLEQNGFAEVKIKITVTFL